MLKSFIFVIIALILIITAICLYRLARVAEQEKEINYTYYKIYLKRRIIIMKILTIIFVTGGIILIVLGRVSAPETFYDDNGPFLSTDKKDSLVFGGNVYILKVSTDTENSDNYVQR